MWRIVFLGFLSICSAELGYHYQPHSAGLDHESISEHQPTDHYQEHADFHKHFYAFEAPYDSGEESDLVEHKLSEVAQKNLQVVFIKAPENKAVVGALNALAKQSSEDKTAIFVLNKQTDPHELASKLTAQQTLRKHKPQVHFVKYRTDAEAVLAQQHIQAQYRAAGGRALQPLPQPSLGYSQPPELPQTPIDYSLPASASQPPELPQSHQGYYQPVTAPLGHSQLPELPHPPLVYAPPAKSPELPPQPAYIPQATALHPPELSHSPLVYAPPATGSLAYGKKPELPQQPDYIPPASATQPPELPPSGHYQPELPQQSYYPAKLPLTPAELTQASPQPSYLSPLPNYASSYEQAAPLPLAQQQLSPSAYDLDARTARTQRIDFRVNERHQSGSRMVFPTETPSNRYLPAYSNFYLPAQKRKRRSDSRLRH